MGSSLAGGRIKSVFKKLFSTNHDIYMNPDQTANLLLLCASPNEAEDYLNLFRNSGQEARVRRIHSLQNLDEEFTAQTWDLLILTEHNPEITPDQVLQKLTDSGKDIPAICVLKKPTNERLLKFQRAGAQDAVGAKEMERFLIVAKREITRINEHRELALLKAQFEETQQRCELLLDSSNDAIAYITDGMHIDINAEYARRFGYQDSDELLCLPVIDLISQTDQAEFKDFIRSDRENDAGNSSLPITACHADGSTFAVEIFASNSSFDGEACIQLLLQQPAQSQQESNNKGDLQKKTQLITQLEQRIASAHRGRKSGQIMLMGFDDLARVRAHNGYTNTELAINELIEILTAKLGDQEYIVRFANDTLMLSTFYDDAQQAVIRAEELCSLANNHICEIDKKTIRCDCRLVVYPLGEQTPSAQQVIDDSFTALFGIQQTGNELVRLVVEESDTTSSQDLLDDLQSAIDQEQLILQFQPVVSLHGASQEHYEVSVAMMAGDTNTLLSGKELTFSNDNQLSLDRWLVENAMARLAEHQNRGGNTNLIINLSQATILDEGFSTWLNLTISQTSVPAGLLIFQISSNDASSYLNIIDKLSNTLKKLGCQISISEVSGDNNSLPTLQHLPVDYVKLHSGFIAELQNDSDDSTAANLLKELRNISVKTIIPQVESASILPVIWQCGAEFIQGDYLQAPSDSMSYEFNDVA